MSLRGVLLLDLEQRDPRVKPRPSPRDAVGGGPRLGGTRRRSGVRVCAVWFLTPCVGHGVGL